MTVPSSQRLCHSASAHIAAARRRGKWNNTDSIIVDRLYGRLALGDTVHIVEDEVVLAEMHRACRHGGGIILTVRQHRWLWSGTDEVAHHVRRYQAGELRRKVEAAGFSLICSTSFMTLLLPMLLAARLGPRRQARALSAELAIPRWLNRLLAAIAALDYALIEAGLDLPCSGSRVLVARKA